jgi:two-component system NtrC family sensor kinase
MSTWLIVGLALVIVCAGGFAYGWCRVRTRLLEEAETVRSELAKRLEELAALQQMTLTLSETLVLDHIVGEIATFVRGFVEADGVLVALAPEDSATFQIAAADGCVSTLAGSEMAREDAGLLGEALKENRVTLSHPEDDQRPELVAGFGVKVAAVAPLETHGTVRGVLAAVREEPKPFTSDDIRQLVTVATHTAMALAHASSVELLKRGKEQWEATFDVLSTGIAVVDGKCQIRRANKTLAEMLNRPVTEAIGVNLADELPGDSNLLAGYLSKIQDGEQTSSLTHISTDPEKRFQISASQMRGTSANWAVVQIEDVTERNLIEEQLIQSEKMATVGQLVSGVAHDLNNPITSIAGVADLLVNRGSGSPTDLEHFQMIHEQAERAAHIVRNLLTFARKDPVETIHADINDIAERAAALIHHDMKLREVSFELKLADSLPAIRGDSHELQQVVLNLLTNAIQAVAENPADSPRHVILSTALQNEQVTLEIADSGPGIDEKMLPQIFLPFVTTKPPGEGTGLGLSIAYRIIQAHNGSIEALPRPNGGMSFMVSLPMQAPEEPESAIPKPGSDIHTVPERTEPSEHLSILVLDEDPAVQRSLRMLFASDGHSVDATKDASQASSLLQKNKYDLIIADARATNAAGITFGDTLKADRPDLCSQTILMTADVRPETDEWLRSLGCRYLRKPFDPTDLRATARELLTQGDTGDTGVI